MTMIEWSKFSDDDLRNLVVAFDRQGLPLEYREEGDDTFLRTTMQQHGLDTKVASILGFMTCVLREVAIRGLVIPPTSINESE